jgi:hypothetical protein
VFIGKGWVISLEKTKVNKILLKKSWFGEDELVV